jgi:murein L,D-transpeptidase YcbB/YkuD
MISVACARDDAVNEEIREQIERHRMSGRMVIAGRDIAGQAVFWKLYQDAGYSPLWTNRQRQDDLVNLLGRAGEEGLLPGDYHYEELVAFRDAGELDPDARADFDLLTTDGLLRYMYHMYFGKVNPSDLDPDWNFSRRLDQDPTVMVMGAIASDNIEQYIYLALDWGPYYDSMKALLAEYRERAAREGGGYPAVPGGPTLRKGMLDSRVVNLRERLQASGQLDAAPTDDPEYFDVNLERAVSRFQKEAGIDVDGAVGAGTLAALNVSLQSRIDQIRVNMERARWILRDIRGIDDFVIVNIAAFNARVFRGGVEVWHARTQVGRTYRKSPIFKSDMKYVQFNPTWTVPPGIFKRDILPKLNSDGAAYLQEKHMILVDNATGDEVDPATIDFAAATPGNFRYQVVQQPGPDNALGRAKFIFPNPHFVFLHDTNHPEHFADKVRMFSSGCIRIEHPVEFAELVLNDPGWDQLAIQNVIDSKQTKTVYLKKPLPVLIQYWTVDPITPSGVPEFLPDIYDRDGRVLEALDAPFQFVPPDDMQDWIEEDSAG